MHGGRSMSGERDIQVLLSELSPELNPAHFVFSTLSEAAFSALGEVTPLAVIREEEGVTLILSEGEARSCSLPYSGTYRLITLRVHSSLEAVGLTAEVASALAEVGISANMLAAYFHDHVLVPVADAERALHTLEALSKRAASLRVM